MSLVATLITLVILASSGSLIVGMTGAASDRARAQTAADAAALAAAAEATSYGGQSPYSAASRFASLNGGHLDGCLCGSGASAFQVEVSYGSTTATARSVIEADRIVPGHVDGLHPALSEAVDRLLAAGGGRYWIVSGFRSPAAQEALWTDALIRYGNPEVADDWVARPGTSNHERGLAVDLGGDVEYAAEMVERLGLPLKRPMPWEPWHLELEGHG